MKSLPLLSNHPRVRRWTAAVVASAVALGVCLASYDNVDAAIKQNRIERLNARIENVYTADYQDMADDKLEQEKASPPQQRMTCLSPKIRTAPTPRHCMCISLPTTRLPSPIPCMQTAIRISPVTPIRNRNTAKPTNSSCSASFPARRTPSPSR